MMKDDKPFVVYWNNIPAPYMVERFNALADRGNLLFEGWFNDRVEDDRSWVVNERSWRFDHWYLPVSEIAGRRLHWPVRLLTGRRPDVIVSLYSEPSFLTGWGLAKARGAKTGFWVEVTFDRWVSRNFVKETIKRWLFRRVDAVVTVGEDGREFAERYGTPKGRIFFAPHTIDVRHYRDGAERERQDRDALRAHLGLKGTTFMYVGRLWWGKGIGYLLDAFEEVQRRSSSAVSLLLVGDGPEELKLRQFCKDRAIRNVVFVGFKQKEEMPRYYALGDVFVFPTLGDPYGLVIDEAMACSLPVISSSAAGELMGRLEDGVNGYIVKPEDSSGLAERMCNLVDNSQLRAVMGRAGASRMRGRSPEKWAKDFEAIVWTLMEKGDGVN